MLGIADGEAPRPGASWEGGIGDWPATTRIALESAYFQPASVRRTSKRLGLKTEASIRFERGGDVAAPPVGIARAAALFEKIRAGRPAGALIDRYASPRPAVGVTVRADRIARVLGQRVPAADVPAPRNRGSCGGDAPRATSGGTSPSRVSRGRPREAESHRERRHYGFRSAAVSYALKAPQPPGSAERIPKTIRR